MFGATAHDERLLEAADAAHVAACRAQRRMLSLIAEIDRREAWAEDGARDAAHWLWMRYGISSWKAYRWVEAAHALEHLPRVSDAFERGELGIDKVVELTRFATAETESDLIPWAKQVACGAIRHRGDLLAKASRTDAEVVHRDRWLRWRWLDEGRRFGLEAELPASDGAVVARALERVARTVPAMPEEQGEEFVSARWLRAGGRSGDPPRDRPPPALQRPRPDRRGGPIRHDPRAGARIA